MGSRSINGQGRIFSMKEQQGKNNKSRHKKSGMVQRNIRTHKQQRKEEHTIQVGKTTSNQYQDNLNRNKIPSNSTSTKDESSDQNHMTKYESRFQH